MVYYHHHKPGQYNPQYTLNHQVFFLAQITKYRPGYDHISHLETLASILGFPHPRTSIFAHLQIKDHRFSNEVSLLTLSWFQLSATNQKRRYEYFPWDTDCLIGIFIMVGLSFIIPMKLYSIIPYIYPNHVSCDFSYPRKRQWNKGCKQTPDCPRFPKLLTFDVCFLGRLLFRGNPIHQTKERTAFTGYLWIARWNSCTVSLLVERPYEVTNLFQGSHLN